eukprot:scaffold16424_cov107-Isochrysis_galbana.AAC.5
MGKEGIAPLALAETAAAWCMLLLLEARGTIGARCCCEARVAATYGLPRGAGRCKTQARLLCCCEAQTAAAAVDA